MSKEEPKKKEYKTDTVFKKLDKDDGKHFKRSDEKY
jgi:hypothetical protein